MSLSKTHELGDWLKDTNMWIVKGTTGSGKTFFVEQLKDRILSFGKPVVYVPQYPMFKPQLGVMQFLNLLPLATKGRKELIDNLAKLEVPTTGRIGGMMMGMLDLPGLSGGQRKKLLIAISTAIAIEYQCPFVVLDEPFAGVEEASMPAVLEVMEQAREGVPNLKFIIVTHDHLHLLPKTASLLVVQARQVSNAEHGYSSDNVTASKQFTKALLGSMTASPRARPLFDMYLLKRHFVEQEFALPLMAYCLFALMLGAVVVNYTGGLPGQGKDVLFVFMKLFFLEYPHFGNIINYCYKRGQHMEDYFLNITTKEFAIIETIAIAILQMTVLLAISMSILVGISDFWYVGFDGVLLDYAFLMVTTLGFFLLPVAVPNPIVAMVSALPYTCTTIFMNGFLLPHEYYWSGIKWLSAISAPYHFACAYTNVSDKIVLPTTDCTDSLPLHVIFVNPTAWAVFLMVAIKMAVSARTRQKLKESTSDASALAEAAKARSQEPPADAENTPAVTIEDVPLPSAVAVAQLSSVAAWLQRNSWFIVKGATGSGKTYFVEHLQAAAVARGAQVVFVAQFPMFKPNVQVKQYLGLLPLSKDVREEMTRSLEAMAVPVKGIIGGKMMGMLNLPGLSGGQRKKLYIAVSVALATQYKVPLVVLDEPFAGIDVNSMTSVLGVLKKATAAVPGLKFVIVTHDHFEMLAAEGDIVHVKDQRVEAANVTMGNSEAAEVYARHIVEASQCLGASRTALVDLYIVKRYFVEQEFFSPLVALLVFAVLTGLVVLEWDGELPGRVGMDVIYVFIKIFIMEYPHFGAVINYCYKRGQHMEDYRLNITPCKYGVVEAFVIAVIQQVTLFAMATGIMVALSDFWWINSDVFLIDLAYTVPNTLAYFLLPILVPNPILAVSALFPYVSVWAFLNGVMLPKDDFFSGVKFITSFSPMFNLACAYTHVTDKIAIRDTECFDNLGTHLVLMHCFLLAIIAFLLVKLLVSLVSKKKPEKIDEQPVLDTECIPIEARPVETTSL